MERVRAGNEKVSRVKAPESPKRIKAEATTPEPVERVKKQTQRVYNGGFVKDDKTGMLYRDGEFYKIIDGCAFKCWPDGFVKDQKTDTHVCWFGQVKRKPTDEDLRIASMNIMKCMVKCFPELYYNMETGERENKTVDADGNMKYKRILV